MIDIYICDYSYHTKPIHFSYKSGLPYYFFRLQTRGNCDIVLKDETITLEKGDFILLKPGDYSELFVDAQENYTANETRDDGSGDYFVLCDGEWIDQWWESKERSTIYKINQDEQLISLWNHLIVERRRPKSAYSDALETYLLQALCVSIDRIIDATSLNRPAVVTRMMRFIDSNALTHFKIDDVANHVGLSNSRASHLFKDNLGQTMIEYAIKIRLSSAIERMKYSALPLEQIAIECGFGSYAYFHKVFKKKFGVSPGAYRRVSKY